MNVAFDLISDLHLESWDQELDFTDLATSPVCVVAGDVSSDPRIVKKFLTHLSQCYAAVFYIDGNDEHRCSLDNLGQSYRQLARSVNKIKNVTYLQNNVVVVEGVAILATNGWWGFDFSDRFSEDETIDAMTEKLLAELPGVTPNWQEIKDLSRTDAAYLISSIQRLQTHADVKKIVIVTHTVPALELIEHDIDLENNCVTNCMGNSLIKLALVNDTEKKVNAWCFGHYHNHVDRIVNGVRYVNNCRGRGDSKYRQAAYYPKRIEVEI